MQAIVTHSHSFRDHSSEGEPQTTPATSTVTFFWTATQYLKRMAKLNSAFLSPLQTCFSCLHSRFHLIVPPSSLPPRSRTLKSSPTPPSLSQIVFSQPVQSVAPLKPPHQHCQHLGLGLILSQWTIATALRLVFTPSELALSNAESPLSPKTEWNGFLCPQNEHQTPGEALKALQDAVAAHISRCVYPPGNTLFSESTRAVPF